LDESPVETESDLGLIGVEVVGGDGGDGFDVVVVEEKDLAIELIGL
jgi:hypothetical protein